MRFFVEKTDGLARAGVLETPHGVIETPAFMPAGTMGAVKAVRWRELEELDYRLVLMNALHLHLRPGEQVVRELGHLHRFAGWNGAILTDSGGYQSFSLKGLHRIDDNGVEFRSPYDGSTHLMTPELVVDIQVALGSDIFMPLDHCPPGNARKEEVFKASERTAQWLMRSAARFNQVAPPEQAMFGIVQGGMFLDLRKEFLGRAVELDLPGYAVGGVSVGEEREESDRLVAEFAPLLPFNKPRYLMGVGLPDQLLHAIASGIDMFDCVLPTRMARNGTVFTSVGRINMPNAALRTDEAPLDPNCSCATCRRCSRAYLSHLYRVGDPGVLGHLSVHNLAFYRRLVAESRRAILESRFTSWYPQFINECCRHYSP